MCVILDNNQVGDFVDEKEHLRGLWRALRTGKARLVHGGRLTQEYRRNKEFFRLLARFSAAGQARVLDHTEIERRTAALTRGGTLLSDDPHVIAVGQIGAARLLVTADQNLIRDFTTKAHIDRPRGSVFQRSPDHDPLIAKCCKKL